MKRHIIFDFDGTLANTNNIIIASWQSTFERFLGHTVAVREIEATFGETLVNTVARLIPDEDPDEVIAHYRAYQDAHQNDHPVYVFEGIKELLKELKSRGCAIGIGTSRTASSLCKYLDKLGIAEYVDAIVTMEDVSRHKPDPATIEAVMRKLSARDRDTAIMIGDTKYDIGCANNAGVDSVLVGWSHYVDNAAMAADGYEPSFRIDRPEELLEIIG